MAKGTDCKQLCFMVLICHITFHITIVEVLLINISVCFAVVVVDIVAIGIGEGGLLHSLLENITRMN